MNFLTKCSMWFFSLHSKQVTPAAANSEHVEAGPVVNRNQLAEQAKPDQTSTAQEKKLNRMEKVFESVSISGVISLISLSPVVGAVPAAYGAAVLNALRPHSNYVIKDAAGSGALGAPVLASMFLLTSIALEHSQKFKPIVPIIARAGLLSLAFLPAVLGHALMEDKSDMDYSQFLAASGTGVALTFGTGVAAYGSLCCLSGGCK